MNAKIKILLVKKKDSKETRQKMEKLLLFRISSVG